jgi:thiopurine S-methyltransferase
MDKEFWLDRWHSGEIGFHKDTVNPWLVRHWPAVGAPSGTTVFVPLCGKSLDMRWFERRGHDVVGVELAPVAVEAYFAEAGEVPLRAPVGRLTRFAGAHATLYCGDFFELTPELLQGVGAAYDRGALVALPAETRSRYVERLLDLLPVATPLLLLTVQYDQAVVPGPPFAVHEAEIERLFGGRCRVTLLERMVTDDVSPRLRASGAGVSDSAHLIVKEA